MTKYEIKKYISMNYTFYLIQNTETQEWFAGYDFMGGQEWSNNLCAYQMDEQEALQIKADLESADADDQPENKQPETKAIVTRFAKKTEILGEYNMVEYANFVIRAHERGYQFSQSKNKLYITNPDREAQFEVKFTT